MLRSALAITLAIVTPAAMLVTAGPAHADSAADKKKKQAKTYVDAGLAAQEAGDYGTAIDFYQKAYALVPHPVLLFNIAQAHRLNGNAAEALDHYRRYLAADPDGPHVKASRGFIKELEPMVAALEAATRKAAEEAAAKERERIAAENPAVDEPTTATDERDPETETDEPPPRDSGGMTGKRIAGLAVGGLGLVGIGAGVYFGLEAKGLSDDLSEPGAQYDPQKVADGDAAERNMFIAYGAGAALVITGAVLFAIGGRSEPSRGVSLVPVIDRGSSSLVLVGDF